MAPPRAEQSRFARPALRASRIPEGRCAPRRSIAEPLGMGTSPHATVSAPLLVEPLEMLLVKPKGFAYITV